MRVQKRTALLAVGLGLGGVSGFLGSLIQDRAHWGATTGDLHLSLSGERLLVTAESKGAIHGTQARTADSGQSL